MSNSFQPDTKRWLLRPVGSIFKQKGKSKKINNYMQAIRKQEYNESDETFLTEQEPVRHRHGVRQQTAIPYFKLIEDPRQSQFSYRKCVLIQKILLILTIFYIFVCMIRTELQEKSSKLTAEGIQNISVLQSNDNNLLNISSIITMAIIFASFMRFVTYHELKIDQKKVYAIRHHLGIIADIGRFVKLRQNARNFAIQFCILVVHPCFPLKNIKFNLFQTYNRQMVQHDLNDILSVISLLRVYIIVRALINITEYSTPRASRLCNYNRINHDLLYSVKCMLQEHPLISIVTAFFIQVVILGYGIRVTEGVVHRENPSLINYGFDDYINCVWCIFITMATVGYGDYYPKTIVGRFVCVCAAISGIIISSLLIVSLSAYLTMQASQMTSHLTLQRLNHQQQLQKQATEALVYTMKLSKQLTQKKKSSTSQIRNIFTCLKQRIDTVKYRSRQIKSLVNNNNIMQEMNRLFQLLKESLIELYKNQLQLKNDLIKLNQIRSGSARDKNGVIVEEC